MELTELRVFLKVAAERSFSRAAMKLHRTQPAVSQAVRRLEESVGERLFDRATKDATLTDAGRLLRDYAERLLRLSEEAETAVKDLRDLRRGRVLIGANEASVHAVLPLIPRFREAHPLVHVDVRRIPARQIGAEVAQGSLDFGVLTFQPAEPRLGSIVLGQDELVMLVPPAHPLANTREVTLSECARQTVIAHNDPSHVRDRVLRLFEQHHIPGQHPRLAAEPRRDQARRRDADGRGAAAAPLRRVRDRARRARGAGDAGDPAAPAGAAGLPEGGERSHASAAFPSAVEEGRRQSLEEAEDGSEEPSAERGSRSRAC